MTLKTIKQFVIGTSIAMASVTALAAPITGSIGYSSTADPSDIERSFDTSLHSLTTGDGEVDAASGDLSSLVGMSIDSISFTYDSFSPPQPLWSVDGFSVVLNSISVLVESGDFLMLSGTGVISHANFDDTDFLWGYSTQFGGTFSAGGVATNAVPEPATLALLGAGLIGLAASRKAAKKSA